MHARVAVERERDRGADGADDGVKAPVLPPAGVDATKVKPAEERDAANQQATFGGPYRPQRRRGDPDEDEGGAPDRRERREAERVREPQAATRRGAGCSARRTRG